MIRMKTIQIDKSGKIYLPKVVRQKIKERIYTVTVLPDGTIMLHKIRKFRDPKKALKEYQTLPKIRKSISKIKAEIQKEAFRSV